MRTAVFGKFETASATGRALANPQANGAFDRQSWQMISTLPLGPGDRNLTEALDPRIREPNP
jgi:hypothetical protein